MVSLELDSYVRRLAALRETSPPTSRSETTAWVLWPLLAELGWEYEMTRSGTSLGLLESDLVLSVGTEPPTPALIAAGEGPAEPLSTDRIEAIVAAMNRTGIERALYANATEFLFLAGTGDDQLRLSASDLPARESDVRLYSNERLRERCLDLEPAARTRRRLAVFRDDLATSITALLETKLGPPASPARQTIDAFLEAIADRSFDSAMATGRGGGRESAAAPIEATESNGSDSTEHPASTNPEYADADRDATPPPSSVPPADDPDGEFVVRVFNDRGSIGAVGHSTSAGALREAAEYFFERGLSGIRVPWSPDGEPILLNEEPVDSDGHRWDAYERLENGLYISTEGSVTDRANRLQALAQRAGLRVMLSGDWAGTVR